MKSTITTVRANARPRNYQGRHVHHKKNGKVGNIAIFLVSFILSLTLFGHISFHSGANGSNTAEPYPKYNTSAGLRSAGQFRTVDDLTYHNIDKVEVVHISQRVQEYEITSKVVYNAPAPDPIPDPQEIVQQCLGDANIETSAAHLTLYDLPSKYYPGLDFSSFQAWMPYTVITDKSSAAYKVISDERMYIDENGMCRFRTTEDQFTIDGKDDFVIALGTYYKPKGTCGDRWLIVTSTGMYTAITGDEKDDNHTDSMHMFTETSNGGCAGIIEWLVDKPSLNRDIKYHGTVTRGPIEELQGEILYIYRIE